MTRKTIVFATLSLSVLACSAVVPTLRQMRGPFPIMSTPYFEDGAVDYDGLARELDYVVKSGCPGAIWCQSNDAVDLLATAEKFRGFEACAKAAEDKDITLALGANGTNTAQLIEIAAEIERVAARHPTARIAMISRPPDDARSEAAIESAWEALAKVAKRPVIFQTYGTAQTPTPSVALLIRLAKRHPAIYGFVKEEADGYSAVERMAQLSAAKPVIHSAMAGWGGWQWLLQLRQCGCDGLVTERVAFAPLLAKIWRLHESGETGLPRTVAYAMFRLLCDQRNFPAGLRGYPLYLLRKEGVFRNLVSRQYEKGNVTEGGSFGSGRAWKLETLTLNPRQQAELDALFAEMNEFAALGARCACPTSAKPMAVWDFDGTLLRGDCCEGLKVDGKEMFTGLIKDCIRAGFAANYRGEEGVKRFYGEMEAKLAAGKTREAYGDVARIFAGADVAAIESFARKRFAETMRPYLFAYSLARFRELEASGVENHVISASPDFFVQAAAPTLGVPRERIHGIRLAVKDGKLVNELVGPMPYSDGKTQLMRDLEAKSGGRVRYGFGNSYHTDGPFLKAIARQGGVSLMINGGKVVPGMTELFVCTNMTDTIGKH